MTFANLSSVTLAWRQVFMFDRYGHRNFDESLTTTLPKECNGNTEVCEAIRPIVNPSVNPLNNRFSSGQGWANDASGNTTNDPQGRPFKNDGEIGRRRFRMCDRDGAI